MEGVVIEPYYSDEFVTIYHGDCRDVLPSLEGCTACVTDPPYGLEFMGKDWDHGVPGVNFWQVVSDALLPGAPLLAFGGTRTHHRLMCGIEDAGFVIRDCLMWLYGSGFPKSLDIGKALDKAAGVEREVVGLNPNGGRQGESKFGQVVTDGSNVPLTMPATEAAKLWHGWGTALKPAHEIIVGAQKPQEWRGVIGTTVRNIMEAVCLLPSYAKDAGALFTLSQSVSGEVCDSALWPAVERCSTPGALYEVMATLPSGSVIPTTLSIASSWLNTLAALLKHESTFTTETVSSLTTDLRTLNSSRSTITPAVIIGDAIALHGTGSSASLADATFSAAATKLRLILTRSAHASATGGARTSSLDVAGDLAPAWEPIVLAMKPLGGTFAGNALEHGVAGLNVDGARIGTEGGTESVGEPNRLNKVYGDGMGGLPAVCANKGRWPANVVLDSEAAAMLDEMSGERASGSRSAGTYGMMGFHGNGDKPMPAISGDSGGASRFFYTAKASRSDRGEGNNHPTVKPSDLMKWLCTLVRMPERNLILDPFAGSGTTLYAAKELGLRAVGIELDEAHCETAAKRLVQGVLAL